MAAFRFFRLNITAWVYAGGAPGTTGDVRITTFQLFDGSDVQHPTSSMTSNTSPSPLVASASSTSGGWEPWRAFAGTTGDGNRWISSSAGAQWLQIDLGSGNAIEVTKIKLSPDSVGSSYYISAFNLVGSNTGSFSGEEVVLMSESGLTGWTGNTLRTFDIPLKVSGVVTDAAGSPAARTVRLYRRDTGALLSSTTSNGSTGAYELATTYTDEVQVVCLDDAGGTLENDLIHRAFPV